MRMSNRSENRAVSIRRRLRSASAIKRPCFPLTLSPFFRALLRARFWSQYQRAKRQQGSLPIIESGLASNCQGLVLLLPRPQLAAVRKWCTTERALIPGSAPLTTIPASLPFDPLDWPCHSDQQSNFRYGHIHLVQ
jgi:hypothetical protein